MKNKKFAIILLILFVFVASSYAIYKVGASVSANLSTAKWSVKVKDKELKTPDVVNLNFTKDDIVWEPNSKVKTGTVAPGSKGSITFNVDATGTEVSTDVLVEITKTSNNPNISVKTDNRYTFIGVNDPNKAKPVTINIEWLKNDGDANNTLDNNEINKLFDINVKVTVKQSLGATKFLKNIILESNGGTSAIKAKGQLDFDGQKSNKQGMFMAEDDYGESYYYRGEADNWVEFGAFYWRVVRINGDGSIRMIYSGTKDNHAGEGTQIGTSDYNKNWTYDDPKKYVDYKISNIKASVDAWYKTNIEDKNLSSKIADSGFCNDMSIYSEGNSGYSTFEYGAYGRNGAYGGIEKKVNPELKCPNKSDLLTKENNKLAYPVGLINADEALFAGSETRNSIFPSYNYLSAGKNYWTMSPGEFNGRELNGFIINDSDKAELQGMGGSSGVRPVINLKSDVIIISGDGTESNPFVVN